MRTTFARHITSLLSATLILSLTNFAYAKVEVKVESALGVEDSVETKTWCGNFPYDAQRLVVMQDQKAPIILNFCTAYGAANAKAFTDSLGRPYVLLEYGEGHGTNVTTNYLKIYRVIDRDLLEVMQTMISWPISAYHRFTYTYTTRGSRRGGIVLTLSGKADEGSPCCMPSENKRVIRIEDRN